MGQPAARYSDDTAHGGKLIVSPGFPTVRIEGKPAWRAGSDVHACALVNGVVPHVGGVAAPGSATVMIGGLPAARAGDYIVEAGGPNPIISGAATVFIG